MNDLSDQLPHYNSPPVIEVVLGVQFEELPGFLSVHFGSFWECVRSDYPEAEDRPPLPSVFEERPSQEPSLDFLDVPPLRRVFLVHSSKNYLLQVQPTRFLHNWRKLKPTDAYPRFAAAEERFLSNWSIFRRFVEQNKFGSLKANQYELTYINHILSDEKGFPHAIHEYSYVFNWPNQRPNFFLPDPASLAIDVKFRLPEKRAMLHVNVKHGRRLPDKMEVLILELTARGPAQSDASDMKGWFSTAHEWIVRGFTDLTTTIAHERWGRTR
jgi:uncharacterized protein (TIGR04255 family)